MNISISTLTDPSRCEEILALYRKSSATLGFMPRGAFDDGIAKGTILAAFENDTIVGYLLYRIARGRASIAHLCVGENQRGKKIGLRLVDQLKMATSHLDCITLRCRCDYEVNKIWPKFGFTPRNRIKGRGVDGTELIIWRCDHERDDLFSFGSTSKIRVAIDSNVFFDLIEPSRQHHASSSSLTEAWIDETVELSVTTEILNDIERCPDNLNRNLSRKRASEYPQISAATVKVDAIVGQLRDAHPELATNARGESDVRHLAIAIADGVKYFVTRDQLVLDRSPEILQEFDLHILKPVDLVGHLDQLERECEYQPHRLHATAITAIRARSDDLKGLVESFVSKPEEKRHDFQLVLDSYLTNPRQFNVRLTHSDKKEPILLSAIEDTEDGARLKLLRLATHPLAPTVLRHLLMQYIREHADNGRRCLHVDEPLLTAEVKTALKELGFHCSNKTWSKPLLRGFLTEEEIQTVTHPIAAPSPENLDQLENFIWPAKIDTAEITNYLIPIRAEWAERFFDLELSSMRLPGICTVQPELNLGVESVYYSASKLKFTSPGRILWYVSRGNEDFGSMEVKAISRLRGVVRDTPKELFKRFRRLGVYEWTHVYSAAKKNLAANLIALRFSHTELFRAPVKRSQLAELGVKANLQGPRSIPYTTFKSIYNLGILGTT